MVDRPIYDVRQTQYPPVMLNPPADDRGVAPARRIGQEDRGPTPPPLPPAVHQPKLLVPGHARMDAQAAENRAMTDVKALGDALQNAGFLILRDASPAQIDTAKHSAGIAKGEAELATMYNLSVQREYAQQRWDILKLAETELGKLERDNPNPSPPTLTKLEAAADRLRLASNDLRESEASVVRAEYLLRAVIGRSGPATAAATAKYPSLMAAEGKFFRAFDQLNSLGRSKDVVKQHLAQLQKAAVDLRAAWALARTDAGKGHDTALQKACDVGFEVAEANVQSVTDPAFVKAQENR
jgi:hypothetical protein